jgi:hypothetical protein
VIDLTVSPAPPPPPPTIGKISISGGQVIVSGTNNNGAGGTYKVLTSTNVLLPRSNWSILQSGMFDGSGNFSITNPIGTNNLRFYQLQVP